MQTAIEKEYNKSGNVLAEADFEAIVDALRNQNAELDGFGEAKAFKLQNLRSISRSFKIDPQ